MHLAHIADMRHHRQPVRMGGMGDLDIFGDPRAKRVTSGWTILHRACPPDEGR